MSEHLDKARAALEGAKELVGDVSRDEMAKNPRLHKEFMHLIDMAAVQAGMAQAVALERIADALEAPFRQKGSVWVARNELL